MRPSLLSIVSALASTLTLSSAQQYLIPVPWQISGLEVANVRHGTGGFWQFNISDIPTLSPQGFNTQSCYYYGQRTAIFALDDYPVNVPCNENFTDLTFTFAPTGNGFVFILSHVWGPAKDGLDNGTWTFTSDDVRGQQNDVANNFGQAGSFSRANITMYPQRSTPSMQVFF